jgi:uncharacterized protein involved in tolerance to divalent cations
MGLHVTTKMTERALDLYCVQKEAFENILSRNKSMDKYEVYTILQLAMLHAFREFNS